MTFQDVIIVWVLIFVRLTVMFSFLPVFRSDNVPMTAKILFSSIFSFVFLSTGAFKYSPQSFDLVSMLVNIVFEAINGLTLGFAVLLIMNAIYLAGHMIDTDVGFSMVNVISPQDESSMPITANFYYMLMLVVFIGINAHHTVIDAFALSLNKVPLGSLGFNVTHLSSFTELMSLTFVIGFRMAIPVLFTILVSNLVLGLLSKAMPGMNVFMIGMPFKILVGLLTLLLILPFTYTFMVSILETLADFLYGVVGRMYL